MPSTPNTHTCQTQRGKCRRSTAGDRKIAHLTKKKKSVLMNIWATVIIRAIAGGMFLPFSRISNHNPCHYSDRQTWAGGCSGKHVLFKAHPPLQAARGALPALGTTGGHHQHLCSHHNSDGSRDTPKRMDRRGCPWSREETPPCPCCLEIQKSTFLPGSSVACHRRKPL